MMPSVRVGRLRRDRGVSVARPTPLGNPYVIGVHGSRDECVSRYRRWLADGLAQPTAARAQFDRIVARARLGDVTLLCWCRSVDETAPICHADVVAEFVRELLR